MDLYTLAYVRSPEESRQMAEAGVDAVVPHVGLTVGGIVGTRRALALEEVVAPINAIIAAARAVSPTILALAHGGPIAEPEDVAYILAQTASQGFVGASSMERLPVEKAIVGIVREFKEISASPPRGTAGG